MNNGLLGIPSKILSLIRATITSVYANTTPLTVNAAQNQTSDIINVLKSDGTQILAIEPPSANFTGGSIAVGPKSTSLGFRFGLNAGEVLVVDGNPSISSSITTTFRALRISEGGSVVALDFSSASLAIATGGAIKFSSTSNITGTKDTGFARDSAGVIRLTDGSTGYGGLLAVTIGAFSTNIKLLMDASANYFGVGSTSAIKFSSTTAATGSKDSGINRQAAGIVQITDGSSGYGKIANNGLQIKEGSNQTMGTATLVGGTVTVNTTQVTASSRIFLTIDSPAGTLGFVYVSARVNGTSFTITSSSAIDTSSVAWLLVEPAA